jgi:outer membrane lipoprotein LolB
LLVLPLAACSLFQPLGPALTAREQAQLQARTQALAAVRSFYISARLAVNADSHAWNGSLRWEQLPRSYVMNFNTPTGQGALQLTGSSNGVSLKLANGETRTADNPEDLLYNQTGLDIPLRGLRYWIMGLPQPDNESIRSVQLDGQGRITAMEQSGWTIEYRRYQTVDGLSLPRKLDLHNRKLSLRLVIDRWELNVHDS